MRFNKGNPSVFDIISQYQKSTNAFNKKNMRTSGSTSVTHVQPGLRHKQSEYKEKYSSKLDQKKKAKG